MVSPPGAEEPQRERQRDQPLFLTRLETTRRVSGLFFGLYVLAHMIHQAFALGGQAIYDGLRSVVVAVLANPIAETVFVWAPLGIHLASDVAFRLGGGRKGGGLRRRFSAWSGYALLVLVALHVAFTRLSARPSVDGFDFTRMGGLLDDRGLPLYFLLIALAAVACVHLAAGTMNVVHQIKSIDKPARGKLDVLITAAAVALFLGVCAGLVRLGG